MPLYFIILNSPGKGETFKSEEDRLEWEEEQINEI
jgi:hypothetical protein